MLIFLIITNLSKFLLFIGFLFSLEALFFILNAKLFRLNVVFIGVVLFFTISSYLYLGFELYSYNRYAGTTSRIYWAIGFMVLHLVPKMVIILVWLLALFFNSLLFLEVPYNMPSGRRDFIGKFGLVIAAIPFAGIIHGILKGKYNFKVFKKTIYYSDLPKEFDGLKILQISDLHSGSFDDEAAIQGAIDLINQQEADLFLFTGDIVNTKATEFEPWISMFNGIKEFSLGKYSVLGNHDYGEYVKWNSAAEKQANFEAIQALHDKVGFQLLNNQNVTLSRVSEKIKLIGVENWGRNFKQAGDLSKACEGVFDDDFKILMSHDPSHWDEEVQHHPSHFHLTLSGHTHGLQFGVEIPGYFKWSPVQYVYKQWAGLYHNMDRYLYVNRGFGFHAFPGRVGIWPEITVLELKRK